MEESSDASGLPAGLEMGKMEKTLNNSRAHWGHWADVAEWLIPGFLLCSSAFSSSYFSEDHGDPIKDIPL